MSLNFTENVQNLKVSVIGLGFVGNSMYLSFNEKIKTHNLNNVEINGYDKYKSGGIGSFDSCLNSDIIFTALPTLFSKELNSYDNTPTKSVVEELSTKGYNKIIVIKSTVEPTFTEELSKLYPHITFIHNPEFLTARTAYEDFHNQTHIVLGRTYNVECVQNTRIENDLNLVKQFYNKLYYKPELVISICSSTESELMKILCNTFYAIKVQTFTEFYLLNEKLNKQYETKFDTVVNLMLKNNWINPMHTTIPGPDTKISYGGLCFPKDTNALLSFMKKIDTPRGILNSCVDERNEMRDD